MLTDAQIHEIAQGHIKKFGGDLILSKPVVFTDPDGIFFKVGRPVSDRSTNLVSPFLVLRDSGEIIPVTAGDVMPGVVTKLWGWQALRADPELQMAVVDPDFSKQKHVDAWAAIVKEIMSARKAAKPS